MKTISLVSNDLRLNQVVDEILRDLYHITVVSKAAKLFEYCFVSPPDLVMCHVDILNHEVVPVIASIKSDPLFSHLPVIGLCPDTTILASIHFDTLIDDYLLIPFTQKDLQFRTRLCLARAIKVRESNPLTRLPGNIMIIREIQRRIDDNLSFACLYLDLDNFKPFNDRYGFSRGDEVLRMTGRLIMNMVRIRPSSENFVGHIGGDDFVAIVGINTLFTLSSIEQFCKEIITHFDALTPSFYDSDDKKKGFIESVDREGKRKTFPFISISIGVAHTGKRKFEHYGEVSEVASEMKKLAKKTQGSSYKIDRRGR